MQSVSTLKASFGAFRHAHSFVTSSQPDGSASPMGIKQLKMQDGWSVTAGRAVIVYSAAETLAAVMLADMAIDVDMLLLPIEDVDDWPMTRATREEKMRRNFMAGDK